MSYITGEGSLSLLVSRSWIDRRTSVESTCSHVADVYETSRTAKERQKQRPLLATGASLPTWVMCLSLDTTHLLSETSSRGKTVSHELRTKQRDRDVSRWHDTALFHETYREGRRGGTSIHPRRRRRAQTSSPSSSTVWGEIDDLISSPSGDVRLSSSRHKHVVPGVPVNKTERIERG
eukprot:scaffold94243_cov26-Cyclotella_meneghiniana.AAC.1